MWLLAKQLVEEESLEEDIDMDLLELACWWHDVQIIEEEVAEGERVVDVTASYVKQDFPAEVAKEVAQAIATHEFGSEPTTLIGKILQDTDKLEILSRARVDEAMEGVESGFWSNNQALQILESIKNDWLPQMPSRYHFEFSRSYHQKHLDAFIEYIETMKELLEPQNPPLR